MDEITLVSRRVGKSTGLKFVPRGGNKAKAPASAPQTTPAIPLESEANGLNGTGAVREQEESTFLEAATAVSDAVTGAVDSTEADELEAEQRPAEPLPTARGPPKLARAKTRKDSIHAQIEDPTLASSRTGIILEGTSNAGTQTTQTPHSVNGTVGLPTTELSNPYSELSKPKQASDVSATNTQGEVEAVSERRVDVLATGTDTQLDGREEAEVEEQMISETERERMRKRKGKEVVRDQEGVNSAADAVQPPPKKRRRPITRPDQPALDPEQDTPLAETAKIKRPRGRPRKLLGSLASSALTLKHSPKSDDSDANATIQDLPMFQLVHHDPGTVKSRAAIAREEAGRERARISKLYRKRELLIEKGLPVPNALMNLPERPWKTIKNGDEAEKSEGDGAGAVKGSSELENGEDRAASDNIPPPSNPPSNPVPPSQYKFDKERGVWEFSGPGSGNTFGGRSDEESRTNENGSAAGNHDAVSAEIRRITNATYAKRRTKSEKWTDEETEKFYEALSMCGTDFTLAVPLFPGRNQRQLKNKYTREERADPARVAQALKRRTKLDPSLYAARRGTTVVAIEAGAIATPSLDEYLRRRREEADAEDAVVIKKEEGVEEGVTTGEGAADNQNVEQSTGPDPSAPLEPEATVSQEITPSTRRPATALPRLKPPRPTIKHPNATAAVSSPPTSAQDVPDNSTGAGDVSQEGPTELPPLPPTSGAQAGSVDFGMVIDDPMARRPPKLGTGSKKQKAGAQGAQTQDGAPAEEVTAAADRMDVDGPPDLSTPASTNGIVASGMLLDDQTTRRPPRLLGGAKKQKNNVPTASGEPPTPTATDAARPVSDVPSASDPVAPPEPELNQAPDAFDDPMQRRPPKLAARGKRAK